MMSLTERREYLANVDGLLGGQRISSGRKILMLGADFFNPWTVEYL